MAYDALQKIKQAMMEPRYLFRFDPSLPSTVVSDASSTALGATLLQVKDNEMQPVEYASRVLSPAESRYTNTERELLAATWAIGKKFRPYLEGRHFTLKTDCKSLLGNTRLTPETNRLVRLRLKLASFSFTTEHIQGSLNSAADALSRPPGVLAAMPCSPPTITPTDITTVHLSMGHANWKKVLDVLRPKFPGSSIRQLVWRTILSCQACNAHHQRNGLPLASLEPIKAIAPRDILVCDILGPLPDQCCAQRYGLLAMDHFSRFAFWVPLAQARGPNLVAALQAINGRYGFFRELICDPGQAFKSRILAAYLQATNQRQHLGEPGMFKSTGAIERLVRTLKNIMVKRTSNGESSAIKTAVHLYNLTPHSATNHSPTHVFFTPTVIQARLAASRVHEWARHANRKRRALPVGISVRRFFPPRSQGVHNADRFLRQRSAGPYQVVEHLPFNRFLLQDAAGHRVTAPASQLRPILAPS
jgi:hypothetical protein